MMQERGKASAGTKNVLWIITELYHPENNQTGYYMTHIGEGLTENYDVKVICGQPNYAFRGVVAPKHEIHKKVEIFRVSGTTLDKNVLLFRLINMFTHGWSVFIHALLKIRKGDRVLTVSAPPSLPFISAVASVIKKVEYSLIIQDKYPEILVAVKKAKPGGLPVKIFNRLNRWLYKNAEKIIVVGRDMEELVKAQTGRNGLEKPSISVIPNWAALEEIEPRPKNESPLLKDLDLTDKFIFLYAGNMGHPQDVESIIECAARLKTHEFIRFMFIGGGVKRKWIEAQIEKQELANVFLLDPMPREDQTLFLNACDVGFVSLVSNMYGVAMPSRTYNILAAGKPVLALTEKNSEVERIVREHRVGWVVPPQDPDKLYEAILEIYESGDRLREMSKNARRTAVEHLGAGKSIAKYVELFGSASDNDSCRAIEEKRAAGRDKMLTRTGSRR